MFPVRRRMNTFILLGISVAITQPSSAVADKLQNLFINAMDREEAPASTQPSAVRTRPVRVNFDLFALPALRPGDKLGFNLFDDTSLVAIFERLEVRSPSSYTWFGRLAHEEYSSFVLVMEQGVMAASIRAPGKGLFQIGFLGAGVHVIREIDESKLHPCGAGSGHVVQAGRERARTVSSGTCVDDGSQIDVLVVYTPAARITMGGTAAIKGRIQLSVDIANNDYANSLINPRLKLVRTAEIDYDESGLALSLLRDPDDGVMDEVHDLRDEFHADLVSLIVEDLPGLCGVAAIMLPLTPFEHLAFSVVKRSCLGGFAFAHELGHNMGCAHGRAGTNRGFFDYSFGYSFVGDSGQTWSTVMAAGIRIPNFSNPNVLSDGQPTGVAAGNPDSADNARTINETALIIANFRPSVPSDCNGNGIGDDQDIANGTSNDQNGNGIPDECDITLHVDAGAPLGGDGMSWATAYTDLQDALVDVTAPCNTISEIWVAAGTYTPDRGTGDRNSSFRLQNVPMYGGFAGNESTLAERAGLFDQTILSGDLSGNDGPGFTFNSENSYHVLNATRTNASSVLDGFTITGGNANGPDQGMIPFNGFGGGMLSSGGSTVRNCNFTRNTATQRGGGIYYASPELSTTLIDCTISENTANFGGGMFVGGTLMLINCEFTNNSSSQGGGLYLQVANAVLGSCAFSRNAAGWGAGLSLQLSASTVINSTFSMNSAANSGGGVYLIQESTLALRNSVLWNNTDTAGANSNETAQVFDESFFGLNVISVEYSCVQDDNPNDANVYPGTGNIDDDPIFLNPGNHDLRLLPGSPCIDAGDPSFVSQAGDSDINGEPRIMGCRVDMGVDEMTAGQPNSGDLNADGVADLLDAPLFVNALLAAADPANQCVADTNGDGNNDGLDIELFVAFLLSGP